MAPIDNPQVVVLVTLYNPTGEGGHQGGGVAAPVGGQIFSEIEMPDLLEKTLAEAQKIAKENEIELVMEEETEELDKENTIIKEQVPKAGIKIKKGNKIYVKGERIEQEDVP